DTFSGGNGFDSILGGEGNDLLGGGLNSDTLDGGNGDDVVNGGNGPDHLFGGAGADTIAGGVGSDSLDRGGHDAASDASNSNAIALNSIEFTAGQNDSITGIDGGDVLDVTDQLAGLLTVGGVALGASDVAIGSALSANTNIAFDDAGDLLMIDLNGDGTFNGT